MLVNGYAASCACLKGRCHCAKLIGVSWCHATWPQVFHRCSTGVSQVFHRCSAPHLCASAWWEPPLHLRQPGASQSFCWEITADLGCQALCNADLAPGRRFWGSSAPSALNQSQAVLLKGGKIAKTFPKVYSIETRLLWWIIQSFMRFRKMVPSWKLRRTSAKRMADPEIV